MVPDVALTLLGGGFAATLALGGLWLALAPRWHLLAHPNARSSHQQSRVTAGGITFAIPLLGYLAWLGLIGVAEAGALAVAGTLLALMGLWDDVRELPAGLRLVLHLGVAAGLVQVLVPGVGLAAWVVLLVGLAWHVNLYNFMDGIDGIAAVQTLVFVVGAQVVGLGLPAWSGDVAWLVAGCMVAFLVFNLAPARLFMGDTGSHLLGIVSGALALIWWQQGTLPLPAAFVLLSGFWLDATYTLIVRVVTGQAFTQAHRSHLYQKLAARRGHSWTTACFLLYAVFWLLPLSWLCARFAPEVSLTTVLWLSAAVAPLLPVAWWLGAGLAEGRAGEPHA